MQSWAARWRGPAASDSCWAKWLLLKCCSRLNVFPTLHGKFVWEIVDWPTCCVWRMGSLKRASMLNSGSDSTSPVVEGLETCSRNAKSYLHWDGEDITTILVEKQCREVWCLFCSKSVPSVIWILQHRHLRSAKSTLSLLLCRPLKGTFFPWLYWLWRY